MTPVKVPTVPCADATPGQETAATNATAAKDGFDMLNLPRSLGDQPATESVDANDRVLYLELGRNSHNACTAGCIAHKTIARPDLQFEADLFSMTYSDKELDEISRDRDRLRG